MATEVYVDSSALVAIAFREPTSGTLLDRLESAGRAIIGAPNLVEVLMVLSHRLRRDARRDVDSALRRGGITVEAFTPAHYEVAADAFLRYGKGRHPARLNFGDCLAYAGATIAGLPLLYVGDDFALTDIEPAIPIPRS